jgi:hypothetical protein
MKKGRDGCVDIMLEGNLRIVMENAMRRVEEKMRCRLRRHISVYGNFQSGGVIRF